MRVLSMAGLVLLAVGCMPTGESLCRHDPPLTYENYGKGFTEQFCTGCHSSLIAEEQRMGAPEAYNFDTYEGILYWADKMGQPVADGIMPPGGGPTDIQKELFAEWMECEVMPDAELYWGEE